MEYRQRVERRWRFLQRLLGTNHFLVVPKNDR